MPAKAGKLQTFDRREAGQHGNPPAGIQFSCNEIRLVRKYELAGIWHLAGNYLAGGVVIVHVQIGEQMGHLLVLAAPDLHADRMGAAVIRARAARYPALMP